MQKGELEQRIRRCRDNLDQLLAMTPDPADACSVCGTTEDMHLVPITVTVAPGEEGYAQITMLLCDQHLSIKMLQLLNLGFMDHNHGGIDYLEDLNCPGRINMNDCPTPTNGPVLLTPDGPRGDDLLR